MNTFKKLPKNHQTVIVVGSGISGLMDAFALHQAGFEVTVISKGVDPRSGCGKDYFSSTHNGELGRFISRFEGEHYLGSTPMYPDMKKAFATHVTEGGWLGKFKHELNSFDKKWLKLRAAENSKIKKMNETEKMYVDANGKAMALWQEIIKNFPELFKQADLLNTGIMRLYDTPKLLEWAVKRHKKEGVLEKALNAEEVAKKYPYFAEAAKLKYIAGAVEAPGFSFNIHKFCSNLINYLENGGVKFQWNTSVYRIKFIKNKIVDGLVTSNGIVRAKNYSLNTGAYAEESLYKHTPAEGKLAGVAGRWMFMPAPKNFKKPVKIHGDSRKENGKNYPIVDINLTHFTKENGEHWIAVGGGYAYLGKPPFKTNSKAFDLIDTENERTISRILGPTYKEAKANGLIKKSTATCVRSFTYDDLPIQGTMPTSQNGLLKINAGTNTGTTNISPYTAAESVNLFK